MKQSNKWLKNNYKKVYFYSVSLFHFLGYLVQIYLLCKRLGFKTQSKLSVYIHLTWAVSKPYKVRNEV